MFIFQRYLATEGVLTKRTNVYFLKKSKTMMTFKREKVEKEQSTNK